MDKKAIFEYVDARALVKETEEDIQNNRKSTTVYDKVRGSNPEFPYQPQSFSVQGIVEEDLDDEEEKILQERKLNAKRLKVRAEKAINAAPVRMQRIIRFRIMEDLKWSEVAEKMGGNCTGDSVRKEFQNWMKEK